MNLFFKDIVMNISPKDEELVLFSCDDIYFQKYGIYNLLSCNDVYQHVHVHIINPSLDSLVLLEKIIKKLSINVSYSTEILNTNLNFYAIKSYYYCSRFYVARWLFEKYNLKKIHIVDADVIFNEKIIIPDNITLAVDYNSDAPTLWQKIMAGYIFISVEEINFLNLVIDEYSIRYVNTDFNAVSLIENKIEKANFTGLDQVCLSVIFEKLEKERSDSFLNTRTLLNFKGKGETGSKIWMLLGKAKKNKIEDYLQEKYLNYFMEIQ
jgi:hypothetical protein